MKLRAALALFVVLAVLLGGVARAPLAGAGEDVADLRPARDTIHVDQQWLAKLPIRPSLSAKAVEEELAALAAYEVGAIRRFPALDAALGYYAFKGFVLRAIGPTAEIWVATDEYFPIGDCRNPVEITDEQLGYLLSEFENKIRPTDTNYFGLPRTRDGSRATLPKEFRLPADYYAGSSREIILVDNIRDDNYYTPDRSSGYIAGFFSRAFTTAIDRNIITIDAWDWLHRTGPNPPNNPSDDPCQNYRAVPFLYEATIAHEYQHLIHADYDPGEQTWVNEGMAAFAELLNGYSSPALDVTETGYDDFLQSFLGNVTVTGTRGGQRVTVVPSGAENSLTVWGDQGGQEISADYGIAYAFMIYVSEHFGGQPFMRYWHNSQRRGVAGFEEALARFGYGTSFAEVFHNFAVAMLVDRLLDDGATGPNNPERYRVRAMRAQVNVDTDQAYSTSGAPPFGSDYLKIADPSQLSALAFNGQDNIVRNTPWRTLRTAPAGWRGGPVLWSGSRDNYDAWLVREITLGDGPQILSFDTYYDIEECYDYGVVQVSTDGGRSFTSLANANTTSCQPRDPTGPDGPQDPRVTAVLPGFSGQTAGWINTSFDLSAYAGRRIVLAFHYITDPGLAGNDDETANNGWWIDNLAINDAALSDGSTVSGFSDITAVQPIPTPFTVQVVGIRPGGFAVVRLEPTDDTREGALSGAQLAELAGYDYWVAIVTFDAPTEITTGATIADYGLYALTVTREGEPRQLPGGGGSR